MKSKWGRILARAGLVLGVLILLSALISFFFPLSGLRERAARELAANTGAQVEIGSARLRWWPRPGISLGQIRMQGTGSALARRTGAANQLGDYSLRLKSLALGVAVGPLLKREIRVDVLRLKGLHLEASYQGRPYRLVESSLAIHQLRLPWDRVARDQGIVPEDLIFSFTGKSEALWASGLEFREVVFSGDLDAGILTVESFESRLGTGGLRGNLEIDFERDPAGVLDFEAEVRDIPGQDLWPGLSPGLTGILEGDLDATVRGGCRLGSEDRIRQTLSLTGQVHLGTGVLHARRFLTGVSSYLGQRQDLQDVQFHSLDHSLMVGQGRYVVESLRIDGVDTDWTGHGSVGLDGSLDLNLQIKLPPGFTPELGQWTFLANSFRDGDGRVNLPLQLTGPVARPRVGLDFRSLSAPGGWAP